MVQVSCHRFGNCERFVDQVFQWLHLRHSGQRAPIQFYIDVSFAKFQFGVLATIAGLATSHYVDDVLAVDRNNFLALALLACLSSLLWLGCSRRKKSSSVTSSSLSWCNIQCITDTVWPSNTFNCTRRVEQLSSMIRDVLESGSLTPTMASKL